MRHLIGITVAVATMLVQPAIAQPSWTLGQTYSGNIDIGGVQVPLPSGGWRVIGTSQAEGGGKYNDGRNAYTDSGTIMTVVLSQVVQDKVRGVVLLQYNARAARGNGWDFSGLKTCQRDDILYTNILRDKQLSKACSYVNHVIFTSVSNNDGRYWKQAIQTLSAEKTEMPHTMIESGLNVSDRSNFLEVKYRFNPEFAGIKPGTAGWSASSWNKQRISGDKRREPFVQSVIAWTQKAMPKMEVGLAGDLKKGEGLDWPTAMQAGL
jgi:hypothetical protein